MKELSIEEKAKRYDEATKRVEDIVGGKCPKPFVFTEGLFDYIFPELKESEDERIIKVLYKMAKVPRKEIYEAEGITKEQALAWLEKQGEQKPAFDIDIPFGAKDSELIEASYYIPEGFHAEIKGNNVVIKQGEHKSAWNEEDETNLRRTEYAVMKFFGGDCSLVDWLRKSLKERYSWKPSDEQIKAVKEAACYSSVFSEKTIDNLISLSKDLKKLKG